MCSSRSRDGGLDRRAQLAEIGGRQRLLDVAGGAHRAALLRGPEDALADADERLGLLDTHLRDAHLQVRDPRGDAAAQALEREIGGREVSRALRLAHARARRTADVEEHLERRGVSELTGGAAGEERASVDRHARVRRHHDAGSDAVRARLLDRTTREDHVGRALLGALDRLLQRERERTRGGLTRARAPAAPHARRSSSTLRSHSQAGRTRAPQQSGELHSSKRKYTSDASSPRASATRMGMHARCMPLLVLGRVSCEVVCLRRCGARRTGGSLALSCGATRQPWGARVKPCSPCRPRSRHRRRRRSCRAAEERASRSRRRRHRRRRRRPRSRCGRGTKRAAVAHVNAARRAPRHARGAVDLAFAEPRDSAPLVGPAWRPKTSAARSNGRTASR